MNNAGDRRPETIHHKYPNASTLSKFDYTYDAVGNILADLGSPSNQVGGFTFIHHGQSLRYFQLRLQLPLLIQEQS